MKMKLDRKMKNPNREGDMSDEDFVFADLGKQISPLIITFIPDEQFFFLNNLLLEPHETVSSKVTVPPHSYTPIGVITKIL